MKRSTLFLRYQVCFLQSAINQVSKTMRRLRRACGVQEAFSKHTDSPPNPCSDPLYLQPLHLSPCALVRPITGPAIPTHSSKPPHSFPSAATHPSHSPRPHQLVVYFQRPPLFQTVSALLKASPQPDDTPWPQDVPDHPPHLRPSLCSSTAHPLERTGRHSGKRNRLQRVLKEQLMHLLAKARCRHHQQELQFVVLPCSTKRGTTESALLAEHLLAWLYAPCALLVLRALLVASSLS